MVAFVGMPSSGHEDREAFQEIEIKQVFSSLVKWSAVIRQTERIPEYVSHAIHVARSGRPGPVVLGLPEDMLASDCEVADAKAARIAESRPGSEDLAQLREKLAKAARPLMIIGGPGWSVAAQKALEAFADRFDLPVAPAFRYQDYFDNRHRCYVGCAGIGLDPKLAVRHQGCGCADRAGRAPRRDDHQRLHAHRHPRPQAVPGAHPPLARRAGLGLSRRPADRRQRAHLQPRPSAVSKRPRKSPGAAGAPSCGRPTSKA